MYRLQELGLTWTSGPPYLLGKKRCDSVGPAYSNRASEDIVVYNCCWGILLVSMQASTLAGDGDSVSTLNLLVKFRISIQSHTPNPSADTADR